MFELLATPVLTPRYLSSSGFIIAYMTAWGRQVISFQISVSGQGVGEKFRLYYEDIPTSFQMDHVLLRHLKTICLMQNWNPYPNKVDIWLFLHILYGCVSDFEWLMLIIVRLSYELQEDRRTTGRGPGEWHHRAGGRVEILFLHLLCNFQRRCLV